MTDGVHLLQRVKQGRPRCTLFFQNVLQLITSCPLLPYSMPVKYYNYQYYQSGDYVVVSFIGLLGFDI